MFLEIHAILVDKENRYLDMKSLARDLPGWKSFGEWKKNENGYLQCYYGHMQMFCLKYNNLFAKLKLYKSSFEDEINGIVNLIPFEVVEENVQTDTTSNKSTYIF